MPELEHIPVGESKQIENTIRLTMQQLKKRYPDGIKALRGQHAKDHACVTATFTVLGDLPPQMRVGVFANPGQEYQAWIRYSNAVATVGFDSPMVGDAPAHGSRGMAIKIMGVSGTPLMPAYGPLTQDFLMVNHPVFPFANVEDYQAITQIVLEDDDNPARFFAERIRKKPDGSPDLADPVTQRTLRTLGIIKRIQSLSLAAQPPAYQAPPASPVDNQYFGGAPFLFGEGSAMKFSAKPRSPVAGDGLNLTDKDYLRAAMRQRLTAPGAQAVVFDFQVQVRKESELAGKIDTEIEDASVAWGEAACPFVAVGIITIPPQDFETPERRDLCESLVFTPWNGIVEHRPLGGINRLRRAVYDASAAYRHIPEEAAHA